MKKGIYGCGAGSDHIPHSLWKKDDSEGSLKTPEGRAKSNRESVSGRKFWALSKELAMAIYRVGKSKFAKLTNDNTIVNSVFLIITTVFT